MKYFTFIFFLFSSIIYAQDIPKERLTNWSKAGLHKELHYAKSVNIDDFKTFITEDGSYHLAVIEAFNTLGEKGGILKFNEGEYFFDHKITMPSNVVISGISSKKTSFTFKLLAQESCVEFKGKIKGSAKAVKKAANVNSTSISIDGIVPPNSYAFARYKDKSVLESSWAYNHFGQIIYVNNQNNDEIHLETPLRYAIKNITIADVRVISPIVNSGIENIKIIRKDKTKSKTANIKFDYAANCFVNGIESEKANFAHVLIQRSVHITVTGSYFHHSFSYGSGGVGYGVVAQFSASDNLIENNVFEHLRHSMLLQAGANGNVFGYNYSIDPYWVQGFFPKNSAGDIVLHGNYPFLNLFEGNIAQNLVIDGSHGINGPLNTFFRNRLEGIGVSAVSYPMTNRQNFAANEITSEGFLYGLFVVLGSDHFSTYNNVKGEIEPSNSTQPNKVSLYKSVVSNENKIGTVKNYNSSTIKAQTRYLNNNFTESEKLYETIVVKKSTKWWKFWGKKKNKKDK